MKHFFTNLAIAILPGVISKVIDKRQSFKSIEYHPLFSSLKRYIMEIKQLRFCNDYKTKVGRDLLEDKLSSTLSGFKEYAIFIDMNHKKMTHEYAREKFYDALEIVLNEYHKKWKSRNINPILIEDFDTYHSVNVVYVLKLVHMEFHNTHKSVKECAYTSLNYLRAAFDITIGDVQIIINRANGKLIGDVYEGITNDITSINY